MPDLAAAPQQRAAARSQAAGRLALARARQALFEDAIKMSTQDGLGSGRLWYPYSYLIAMLARRAAFFAGHAALLGGPPTPAHTLCCGCRCRRADAPLPKALWLPAAR